MLQVWCFDIDTFIMKTEDKVNKNPAECKFFKDCNEIQPVSLLTVYVGPLPTQTAVQDPAAVAAQAAMWVVRDVKTPGQEKME